MPTFEEAYKLPTEVIKGAQIIGARVTGDHFFPRKKAIDWMQEGRIKHCALGNGVRRVYASRGIVSSVPGLTLADFCACCPRSLECSAQSADEANRHCTGNPRLSIEVPVDDK